MPGSARERLRHIMLATEHRTRSPEHVQIELLQLIAELLIEVKDDLRRQKQPARASTPQPPAANGNHPEPQPAKRAPAFGL